MRKRNEKALSVNLTQSKIEKKASMTFPARQILKLQNPFEKQADSHVSRLLLFYYHIL